MDDTLAKYSFLPWVRQGLGNSIIETDTLGNALPSNPAIERPEVNVSATITAHKGEDAKNENINRVVKIQGPGDVLGLNQKTIIRTHPKKGVANFETNNLCYVEFYEEDLPWRFTPSKPVGNKLRPWLALIVLRTDEFTKSSSGSTPTPFISIDGNLDEIFCDEKDTYALAHVHVLEDLGNNNQDEAGLLKSKLEKNPDLALSRVICARKLEYIENNNEYHAFLIPAFETGRLAGMGEDPSEIPAQQPSWTKSQISNNTNPRSYPYYFTWSFKVSAGGDFESLAEKLTARELPENIGKREIDLQEMGFGLEAIGDDSIGFVEGAMRHPDYQTAPWPMSDTQLKAQLKDVLNISADLQDSLPIFNHGTDFYSPVRQLDPIISPPTYGKWHSGTYKLSNGSDWVHELNLHPSYRSAAGLGTRVVQQHQEEFMEMAWEQIGQINEANQKIIESELAKRIAKSLVKRKINKMSDLDVINTTGRTLEVLKLTGVTAKRSLKDSKIPTALRSGSFIKVANNFTPKILVNSNGVDGPNEILNINLIEKINTDQISAASPRKETPCVLNTIDAFTAIETVVNSPVKTFMQSLADAFKQAGIPFNEATVKSHLPNEFTAEQNNRANDIIENVITTTSGSGNIEQVVTVVEEVFEERISSSFDEGIYENVKFIKSAPVADALVFDHAVVLNNRIDFQDKFVSRFLVPQGESFIPKELFIRPARLVLEQTTFRAQILTKLDPTLNFRRKLQAWFTQNMANINKPIMAYPRFPFPMYDYLKDISPDYIIPNISEIEPDTITLMEPNKKFIEAFLAGMNHEFSRELLWREFPTDMRGSYFRHFWEYDNDPNNEMLPNETVEQYTARILSKQNAAADINEMHKWGSNGLGANHQGGPNLVLLIKGELFRKYPNTLVYAQKAVYNSDDINAMRELSNYEEANVQWPIITGNIEPDVYFFGFELTEEQANGNRTDNPGWFFVLRERPGQISFGLDDLGNDPLVTNPDNWEEVTWEHLAFPNNNPAKTLRVTGKNITLSGSGDDKPRNATWGASSSDMAYILYQSPILFARHASTMLND